MTGNSFMGVHFGVWAAVSAIIAVVYYFIWPRPVNNINSRPFWRHIVLRYLHSLVWVTMAISFVLRLLLGSPVGVWVGDATAVLAFAMYLVFLVTATIDKRAPN